MKKHLLILALILMVPCVNSFAWKAMMVGHRGSDRGVENTLEAFRNGVGYYGCDALECDVQVTKDGKMVLCHDSKLNNYGQKVVIAEKTLAELQQLTLTQRRKVAGEKDSITFTSQICTLDEYLQLCEDSAVIPVIELKSAKGLNGSNMTGFPALYELLVKHKLDSVAYIDSFDEKAVVWVKQNYPHLTCQRFYMSHLMTDADIAWCVENKIEPSIDISYTNWDVHTVKRFHNAGIKVATWTINDVGTYNEFVRDRCCYMSTGDCVKKSAIVDAPAIDWESIADYKSKLSPFYVTPLDTFTAPIAENLQDTLRFTMANHHLELVAKGYKGGFVIRDVSALNKPILYTQDAFLEQQDTVRFAMREVEDNIVHVFLYQSGQCHGGWYVSNGAPQYQAESVVLCPDEVTMGVKDTLVVTAIVLPEKATSEVSWRIDKTRAFSISKNNRTCQLIAKSLGDAMLIASIDGKKDTCIIHVKQQTAVETLPTTNAPETHKMLRHGIILISAPSGCYDLSGRKQNY